MAMLLEKVLPSGVTTSYHRICSISVQYAPRVTNEGVTGPVVTVEIGEYLSPEARAAGAVPANTEVRHFVASDDVKAFLAPLYALLSQPLDPVLDPPERPVLGYEGAEAV